MSTVCRSGLRRCRWPTSGGSSECCSPRAADPAGAPATPLVGAPRGPSLALLARVVEPRFGRRLLDALEDTQQLGQATDEQPLLVDLDPHPGGGREDDVV